MNSAPQSPLIRPLARRRPWFWIGLALLLIPFVALGVIALGAASYLHLSSDMRALRNGLMKASGVEWRQNLGLNLGSMTLGVVRAGLSLAPLDAQARAAVQTLRGIEVGIYELTPGTKPPDRVALLTVADTVLKARGWERVVGVLDGEELVCVYVPATAIASRQVKCCVLVFDGRQMVVVSARANVQPLWECLRHRTNLRAEVDDNGASHRKRHCSPDRAEYLRFWDCVARAVLIPQLRMPASCAQTNPAAALSAWQRRLRLRAQ